MSTNSTAVLKMYRQMLRAGKGFKDYNFSAYSQRRVQQEFRRNINATPAEIPALMAQAKENLHLIQRQALIGSLYSFGNSYINSNQNKSV